jgi:RNA polymerase sigma-70 factor (ECF subfamily)
LLPDKKTPKNQIIICLKLSLTKNFLAMTTAEFNKQFDKIHDLLFAFAMKLTRNMEDAKDLMQETAMRAFANRHHFEPGTHFKSWVSTIMRNSFINDYRKKKTRNRVEKPIEDYLYAVENKAVSSSAHSVIMMKELRRMLGKMTDDYRTPFIMFFNGYQYEEIANHMRLPMGTVKSRIFYARKQLKDMIQEQYGNTNFRRA